MKANSRASTDTFYKDLSILNFDNVVNLELCKFMYRVNRKEIPPNIIKFFSNYQHEYGTRHHQEFQYDKKRNFKVVEDSFLSLAPSRYSRLSMNVRNSPSIKSFSDNIKKICV